MIDWGTSMRLGCRRHSGLSIGAAAIGFLVALAVAEPAHATFPGQNDKIAADLNGTVTTINPVGWGQTNIATGSDPAWSSDGSRIVFVATPGGPIYTMRPDGTDQTYVVDGTDPSWSPDRKHIVFTRSDDIYKVRVDGSGLTQLTSDPARDFQPAWSPDGKKIAFVSTRRGGDDIFLMNADGSGQTLLADACSTVSIYGTVPDLEESPSWSPDGTKIAFWGCSAGFARNVGGVAYDEDQILSVEVGTGTITSLVSNYPSPVWCGYTCTNGRRDQWFDNRFPTWSPDGTKLAFVSDRNSLEGQYDLFVANADGANQTQVTQIGASSGGYLDWGPVFTPVNYARPQGATPTRVALVPAYRPCTQANTSHQAPFSDPSCVPAVQSSDWLTVGTPDANGQGAKSAGSLFVKVIVGDPGTPANEADLSIGVSLTDVRKKADLSDYTGQLKLVSSVRTTDKRNLPGFTAPGTVTDFPFSLSLGCAGTADTTVGSTCSVTTTANALLPGSLKEGRRAIWQLGAMQLFDGGSDGVASTDPNTLFATDGIFVP